MRSYRLGAVQGRPGRRAVNGGLGALAIGAAGNVGVHVADLGTSAQGVAATAMMVLTVAMARAGHQRDKAVDRAYTLGELDGARRGWREAQNEQARRQGGSGR